MKSNKTMNKNMAFLVIIMLVNALSYGTIIPLIYPFAARFGISASGMSLLFVSFSLAQLLATPIIGRFSDRYGRKPLLLISLFGTSVSLALFGLAWSAPILFLARILDGITGGNISVAQAAIADTTKPEDRAKMFGLLGAAFGFGFSFGPALGGVLGRISLTAPFLFASFLALVGTLLGSIYFKETNTHRETKTINNHLIDVGGMVKMMFSPLVGPILLVSVIALTATNAMIIAFQSYTVDVLLMNSFQVGLLFTVFGIIQVIMQGFGIRLLMGKISSKRKLIQLALVSSGMAMMVVASSGGIWGFSISMWVYGLLNSPVSAVISALLSERANAEDQGGIMGINQSYASISQILGPLLAGLVLNWTIKGVFWMSAIMMVVAAMAAIRIRTVDSGKVDL